MFIFLYTVFRNSSISDEHVFCVALHFTIGQFYSIVKWQGIEGTTIKRLYNKNILETSIALPSISEQSAIGSLFRTFDDLLASYKDNLANYQSLKATMLSKMFPKAGQTVPEIRLDGFEGEWVEKN